jgi:tetratricopeptide (TPR) repeat protein
MPQADRNTQRVTPNAPNDLAVTHIFRQAAVLFLLALAVRGVHLWAMRSSPLFSVLICDCAQYDAWAQRIAAGEWIGNEVFYQTPLYPYSLAVIYTICGHSIWAVRLVQAMFGAVACVAIARAGARFFSEHVGWTAGVLLALYPPAIFFDGILQKASLDLLLMTTLLWALGAAQALPVARLFIAVGALLGAMTLNRENSAALVPVIAVWIVWLSWGHQRREGIRRLFALALGTALVLLPVGLRNYYVGGAFLLTTAQMGPNFYIGNHHGADGGYAPMRAGRGEPGFEAFDARLIAEDDLKKPLSSREVSQYWMARSADDIRTAPADWLRLLARKWFLTWNALESIDAESLQTHAQFSPLLNVLRYSLHFGVICPLAMLGIWLTRSEWRKLWILYALLLTFALAVTAFYVFARYRYPLAPVAILFAAAGLIGLWRFARREDSPTRRDVTIGVMLATVTGVACNWPVRQQYNDDAVTFYNAGSTSMAMGRTDDAISLLERAIEADARFPDSYNNLGTAVMRAGDFAAAQRLFEQAIGIAPDHAIFHVNLANTLLKQGNRDRAYDELRTAIQLDPLIVEALGPLAELEATRGDMASAVRLMNRAVELQPQSSSARTDLAMVLQLQGNVGRAIDELRVSIKLDPNLLAARNRLAWLLATTTDDGLRSPAEALILATESCRMMQSPPAELLDTLAAAQAATGDFASAGQTAERATAMARENQQMELADQIESRRRLFLEKKAFRGP